MLGRDAGTSTALIDNLRAHEEGRRFLDGLRQKLDIRARLRTICIEVESNCEWAEKEYRDVLDAYLLMPFTVAQLLDALGI